MLPADDIRPGCYELLTGWATASCLPGYCELLTSWAAASCRPGYTAGCWLGHCGLLVGLLRAVGRAAAGLLLRALTDRAAASCWMGC